MDPFSRAFLYRFSYGALQATLQPPLPNHSLLTRNTQKESRSSLLRRGRRILQNFVFLSRTERGGASRARPTNLHAGQEERPAEAPPSLQPTSFPPGRPLRRRGPPRPPLVPRSPSPVAPPVRPLSHPPLRGPRSAWAKPDGSRAMERSEVSCFSAAFSCTFLASCLLFSAFNRQQRAAYMDEAFHVPQAQAYCAGRFQQVGRRASGSPSPAPLRTAEAKGGLQAPKAA